MLFIRPSIGNPSRWAFVRVMIRQTVTCSHALTIDAHERHDLQSITSNHSETIIKLPRTITKCIYIDSSGQWVWAVAIVLIAVSCFWTTTVCPIHIKGNYHQALVSSYWPKCFLCLDHYDFSKIDDVHIRLKVALTVGPFHRTFVLLSETSFLSSHQATLLCL